MSQAFGHDIPACCDMLSTLFVLFHNFARENGGREVGREREKDSGSEEGEALREKRERQRAN